MTIGEPRIRVEDDRLLTGGGRYVDDIRRPDELAMVFLRSPVAAGRIAGLDSEAALAMPGVVAVFTGENLKADGVGRLRSGIKVERPGGEPMLDVECPLLATDHVQFAGDPVAAVVAETRAQALDAAEAIALEIEEAPAVADVRKAVEPGAPIVWPGAPDNVVFRFERGDAEAVDRAFADAAHTVSLDLDITRVTACPLEPRGALAEFDAGSGRSTLWMATQVPHRFAAGIAAVLGLDKGDLHLAGVDVGGGFGMRNATAREGAVAVWVSRKLKRPVRWISTRTEGFESDPQGRDRFTRAELALDGGGKFLAVRAAALGNLGGYVAPNGLVSLTQHVAGLSGVYAIPAIHVAVTGVLTNTQVTAPYRGAGRPEATYTIERLVDVAARRLGIDRAELRSRNMLKPEDLPCRTALGFNYDSGDFPQAMRLAMEAADWDGFGARRRQSASAGRLRGLGIAMSIEGAGGPYGNPSGEFAELNFDADGRLHVLIGSGDSGQGHRTTFAQVAADALQVDPADIVVETGDTDRIRDGFGSVGSRTVISAGTAVTTIARRLVEAGRELAAAELGSEPDEIDYADGIYRASGSNRSVALSDLGKRHREELCIADVVAPDDATFPNGCHICEVEIDPEIGRTDLLAYTVVDDVGTVINPLLMKGQMHGGVAQGIGQAMAERVVYDDNGQLVTGSFMDYAMPRAADLVMFDVRSSPVPTPTNPLGAKGAGEAGTVGALPVMISAVCNALAPLGIEHLDMPATPMRVWQAIREVEREKEN
ncbi:MAG TPA: xanthine dehydrogenase family protein molybdopterin-binding subunit [Afifellaceae bacterium]|nr:xanthine dehydrogenase family protein molybdopterin-binding subunit [Afifellaceae bacterium]